MVREDLAGIHDVHKTSAPMQPRLTHALRVLSASSSSSSSNLCKNAWMKELSKVQRSTSRCCNNNCGKIISVYDWLIKTIRHGICLAEHSHNSIKLILSNFLTQVFCEPQFPCWERSFRILDFLRDIAMDVFGAEVRWIENWLNNKWDKMKRKPEKYSYRGMENFQEVLYFDILDYFSQNVV